MSYDRSESTETDVSRAPQQNEQAESEQQREGERQAGVAPAGASAQKATESANQQESDGGDGAESPSLADLVAEVEASGGPEPQTLPESELPDAARDVVESPGESLGPRVHDALKGQVGNAFQDVTVHTGRKATQVAREMGVSTFRVGSDIVLNGERHSLDSTEGKFLVAQQLAGLRKGTDGVAVVPDASGGSQSAGPQQQ